MIEKEKQKHTRYGIELLRALINEGHHIFTIDDARAIAPAVGMNPNYVAEALTYLKNDKWIDGIKRGLYACTPFAGGAAPPHEYEIAQALVPGSAICYWTAMRHYDMTQQLPRTVYSMIPEGTHVPRNQQRYRFVQVKQACFFGVQSVWIKQAKILITDPERTLLEGLHHPEYCGGFREVLGAFQSGDFDYQKLIAYALKLDPAIVKRLGWVLQRLQVDPELLVPLHKYSMKGPRKLDASAPADGPYNHVWQLLENM